MDRIAGIENIRYNTQLRDAGIETVELIKLHLTEDVAARTPPVFSHAIIPLSGGLLLLRSRCERNRLLPNLGTISVSGLGRTGLRL